MDLLTLAALVAILGSPRFADRQEAHETLALLGDAAKPALLAVAKNHDLETRWRAVRLLDLCNSRALVRLLAEFEPMPWIDSLPLDHPDRWDILNNYLEMARAHPDRKMDGDPPSDWPDWRMATRLWLLDTISDYGAARLLVGAMSERCRYWTENRKYPEPP